MLPTIVFGQYGGTSGSSASITSIGVGIVNAVWIFFTVVATIALVFAGILFLTAFGDPKKLAIARSAFLWGIVGIIVALLAYGAINLVKSIIGA